VGRQKAGLGRQKARVGSQEGMSEKAKDSKIGRKKDQERAGRGQE
jgi:hypothetical protein